LRRDAVDGLRKLEKSKEISQDELKNALDRVQKLTDVLIDDVDRIGRDKETELMES